MRCAPNCSDAMSAPVSVAYNADQSRVAFTLFHPTGNILTAEMVAALRAALESNAQNHRLKLVTIEGAGPDFSFGASIPEHAPDQIGDVLPEMHALIYDLLDVPAVTAAVVRGRCLGGGFELALACDFILCSDNAAFGLPEIAIGVFPPAGSALLPLRVGAARAANAALTGETRGAAEWERAGLVQILGSADSLSGAVEAWHTRHFASRSAAALRHAAAAVRLALVKQVRDVLPGLERLYLDELMRTQDAAEGIAAFMDKRQPHWTDR
jgi:cyclohexa-1,5-dienecarbonyl-CoA hydratase